MKKILLLAFLCLETMFAFGQQSKDEQLLKAGDSYTPAAKKSWYSVCENGKYGIKFSDGSTFVPAKYQSVRLKEVAGDTMFEAKRDDGSNVYYSVKKESLFGGYDYFGNHTLRIYGIKSTFSVDKQNIIYVYTDKGLGAYVEDTENNTVEIILDPSNCYKDLRYVNHYFEYKDANGCWNSTEITMELPYVKLAKSLCGIMPVDIRKKFEDLEYSDLYKLQIMAKGYKDAIERFAYAKLLLIYDPEPIFLGDDVYWPSIDNGKVEHIYPMLKLLADSGNANAQFLMGCICSGNKVIAIITEEKIDTPKDYKYLNNNLAIEYFQKFMKNTQKTEDLPFGKSLSELNSLIRKVYP